MFPIVAILGAAYADESETPQGFVTTIMTAMISEVPLSLFGIKFLLDQSRQSNPSVDVTDIVYIGPFHFSITTSKDPLVNLQVYTRQMIVWIYVYAGIAAIPLVCIVVLAIISPWLDDKEKYSLEDQKDCLIIMAFFSWIPCIGIYAYSWHVWHSFLQLTSDDLYCIEEAKWIDLIYCLLPLFLGLWRITAALLSRQRAESAWTPTELELTHTTNAAVDQGC